LSSDSISLNEGEGGFTKHIIIRRERVVSVKKLGLMFIGTILLLILSGCRQPETYDEILEIYDRIADNEGVIESLEEQRLELVEREKVLGRRIIAGGADDNALVFHYLEEVLEAIEKREEVIEEQLQVMRQSMEELELAAGLIQEIENRQIREEFLQVQELHQERYEAFARLSYSYLETASRETRLYTMLQGEEQNLQDLESLIMLLNQRAITDSQLKEELQLVSGRLNDAINELARALERL